MKITLGSWMLAGAAMLAVAPAVAQSTDNTATPADKTFVMKAAEGGMAEVKLGQLAAEKASNPDVKSFGQKMVDDHTNLNNQMMPVAQKLGVTPPDHLNAKDQATYDKLNGLSGDAFDKAYMKDMVMDHRKDLREFKQEKAATTDPDLQTVVASGEKVIAGHLHMATKVAQELGASAPPSSPKPAPSN